MRTLSLLVLALGGLPAIALGQAPRFPRPEAKYPVRVDSSVTVPMRDGVKLSTDLYFPVGVGDRLAVVLIRTPYNKNAYRRDNSIAYWWAGQGYAVATQDTRGRFESEGEFVVSGHDVEDGSDTDDWLAAQSWSSGKVGTYGCSYVGDVQIMQSKARNPRLAAMIPQSAGSSIGSAGGRYHYFGAVLGGAVELAAGTGWFRGSGTKVFYRPPAGLPREAWLKVAGFFDPAPQLPPVNFRDYWGYLPIIDIQKKMGSPPTDWEKVISTPLTDPWWDQFGYLKDTDQFDVPALHVNGWYDFGVAETLFEFNLLRTNAASDGGRNGQFAIISPMNHCQAERATAQTTVGERPLGDAQFDYWVTYLRWFDHWLKGIDNGIAAGPKLQIYVMGKNQWRGENEWPLARTRFTKYYLHSDGKANSRLGSGALSTAPPAAEPSDRFVYDPATPVPSRGGPVCCTGTPDAPEGSFDQSEVELRSDVVVYTTAALERGVEVTGPLQLVLYVSSDQLDTDFTGKLVDVYPDGKAYNVQEGILRGRYRDGFGKKVWMKPGEVYQVKVDLQATSNYFAAGHRIRVEVANSNFPRFDRNLNTGGNNFDETEWKVANNVIHHSARFQSHILLPLIP